MPYVTTSDDVKLHLLDEGAGPAVVLIGGFGMPANAWQLQWALVRCHRVVALDRRCHGASDHPAHGQRLARHGKDVREVLDALELDDVVLVGASMGASTIWAYLDLFGTDRLRGPAVAVRVLRARRRRRAGRALRGPRRLRPRGLPRAARALRGRAPALPALRDGQLRPAGGGRAGCPGPGRSRGPALGTVRGPTSPGAPCRGRPCEW